MSIAPFLLGLAIYLATLAHRSDGENFWRGLSFALALASIVAACIPGGL